MKKLYFLLCALTSLSAQAQTSVYHPFPDSDAIWTQSWGHGTILCSEMWSYEIAGDTTINTNVYHKLIIPQVQQTGVCGVTHTTGYNGCYRQDIPAKKVYYVAPGNSTEDLLYDFNLQVGDTIVGSTRFGCSATIDTIYALDSILIGSTYRKRWTIGNSFSANYIVEGIGYESGLLETCGRSLPDAAYYQLDCFQQNGENLYPDSMTVCDFVETTNNRSERMNVKIFPDPIHSLAMIKVGEEFLDSEFSIYDLSGKKLHSQILIYTFTTFTRERLAAGIYFYELRNRSGETVYGKIVLL